MNVDENGPVAKATVQNRAGFLFVKGEDEDDDKVGLTIFKKTLPWQVTQHDKDWLYHLYTCTSFE